MAEPNATLISIPAAAYLLGSIPFGLLLGKLFGAADVRNAGSGNIGATNVLRVAGPLAGMLTLLLDAAKGALAVFLAARFSNESATWMMIAGLCVLAGHCFPIWLGFRGGKGVATAAGVFLVLCPLAFLAANSICSRRALLAFCVAGFALGRGRDALADLFLLGATPRAAAHGHLWNAGRDAFDCV